MDKNLIEKIASDINSICQEHKEEIEYSGYRDFFNGSDENYKYHKEGKEFILHYLTQHINYYFNKLKKEFDDE